MTTSDHQLDTDGYQGIDNVSQSTEATRTSSTPGVFSSIISNDQLNTDGYQGSDDVSQSTEEIGFQTEEVKLGVELDNMGDSARREIHK